MYHLVEKRSSAILLNITRSGGTFQSPAFNASGGGSEEKKGLIMSGWLHKVYGRDPWQRNPGPGVCQFPSSGSRTQMSSTSPLFFILLATGLTVGFGHCVGMCGPIVVSFSLSRRGERIFLTHLLYHAGRLTTYALLGGLMGFTGSFTGVASQIAPLQGAVLILAGTSVIILALSMGGWFPLARHAGEPANPDGFVLKSFKRLSRTKSLLLYYPLGLLLGLLPCGPVYSALLAAAGAGTEAGHLVEGTLTGAGLMLGFGMGTVPSLLIVGKLSGMGWLRSRETIYRFGSVLMLFVGVYFVIKGLRYSALF